MPSHSLIQSTRRFYSSDNKTKGTVDDFRAAEVQEEQKYKEEQQKIEDEKKRQQQDLEDDKKAEQEDEKKVNEIRNQILEASLPFVSKYGWTREAISRGAESINYANVTHGLFPKDGVELINYFYRKCNREVIERMQTEATNVGKTSEFFEKALRLRLELIVPYRETWPQAIAILAMPLNAPTSLAQLLTFVDDVCHLAGDRSADVSVVIFCH